MTQQFHSWVDTQKNTETCTPLFIPTFYGMSLSTLREMLMEREAWRAAVHGVAKSRTRLSDWAELN